MGRHEFTGLARFPLAILELAEDEGLDRNELLLVSNLSEADLHDPDARLPVRVVWSLWEELIRRVPDPSLGVRFGSSGSARDLGLVGYTMLHSRSLGRAMDRLIRYVHILMDVLELRWGARGDRSEIILENEPEARVLQRPVDSRLAAIVTLARQLTSKPVTPIEVRFCYPEPSDVSAHRQHFRAPLVFGQGESLVAFHGRDLDLPVATSDETLGGYLDRLAEELLEAEKPKSTLVDKVQRAIWSKLGGGQPTVSRMASLLGVSARTLQRRLREEGTSFAEILENLRRGMSVRLLNNRELAVYEVAYLLGYSEPSTFFRAFRRWHGIPPNEFRKLTNKSAASSEELTAPGGEG
jgi:AraC-like DNA-binding protein